VSALPKLIEFDAELLREPGSSERRSSGLATFRDPSGQLRLTATSARREVRPAAAEKTLAFLASPLCATLEGRGDLIRTEILARGASPETEGGSLWLEHPRIDPITYPWEWTPAQWVAAAELTLSIARRAIDAGYELKDATPLNILFVGPRPILVDVLSFEERDPRSSVWLAYGQFVRTFLLPLLALKFLHWPLHESFFARDGIEPGVIYRALRPWQRLYPDLLDVVTLATIFEKPGFKKTGSGEATARAGAVLANVQGNVQGKDPELGARILHTRIARLGKQIRRAGSSEGHSQWSEYGQTASHYSSGDIEAKQGFVGRVLERLKPERVLDIGANTGTYSLMAAERGAVVTALDSDVPAMEALWRLASERRLAITALVANIARPTPAAGWRNGEQLSLLERLGGKFDLVLMLAVIHHLILREQVPLGHIAELCAELTRGWLVLEWVPPSDPMFQEWLRGRDALYGSLSENDLTCAFAPWFRSVERTELGNGRVLLLFERSRREASRFEAGGE